MSARAIALALFCAGWLLAPQTARAECDRCGPRKIAFYDTDVRVPAPADPAVLAEWSFLFNVSKAARHAVRNGPGAECVIALDGAFLTEPDDLSDGFTHGHTYANLPPPQGAPGGQEYLIVSQVDGADGAYSVTVSLQVSRTREIVRSGSAPCATASEAAETARGIVAGFGSVADVIRSFEKSKRDQGHPYGIRPEFSWSVEREELEVGEATWVDLELLDCDDVPLSGRKVSLSSERGRFDPAEVTTGGDGKARTKFRAGDAAGPALLMAVYPFKTPAEWDTVPDGGYEQVAVGDIVADFWTVKSRYTFRRRSDHLTTSEYSGTRDHEYEEDAANDTFTIESIVLNLARLPESCARIYGPLCDEATPEELDDLRDSIRFLTDAEFQTASVNGSASAWARSMRDLTTPDGWVTGDSVSMGGERYQPDPSYGQPNTDFTFIRAASGHEGSRRLDLSGYVIQGTHHYQSRNCDSVEGCELEAFESESMGDIEVHVHRAVDDAGYRENDDVVDEEGKKQTLTHAEERILEQDDRFVVAYVRSTDETYTSGNDGAIRESWHRTMDYTLDATITRLGKAPDQDPESPEPVVPGANASNGGGGAARGGGGGSGGGGGGGGCAQSRGGAGTTPSLVALGVLMAVGSRRRRFGR